MVHAAVMLAIALALACAFVLVLAARKLPVTLRGPVLVLETGPPLRARIQDVAHLILCREPAVHDDKGPGTHKYTTRNSGLHGSGALPA